jgi:hypothetical protein
MAFKISNSNIIDDSRNIINAASVGIGTITVPTAQKLWVEGDGYFSGIASASRFVSTVAQGTAPISVASSTLVTNLNANFLNGFSGAYYLEANNLTGTAPGSVISQSNGLTVTGNLSVSGNVSVSGTSFLLNAATLQVKDRDIVLGITTNANGDDVSNDGTATHGGVSIASTVGTPIFDMPLAGINSSPSTYKQFMWISSATGSSFSGVATDAWISNYAIGIGTLTVRNGSRLTVGAGFTVYDTYLDAQDIRARNINATGIHTAATYCVGATKVLDTVNSQVSLVGIATIDSVTRTTLERELAFAPNDFDSLKVSGISTLQSTTLIGGGTSTGTAGQVLQVTGISSGAYIGGRLGIGITNPTTTLSIDGVLGFANNNIRIGDTNTGCSITSGNDNFFAGSQAGRCNTSGRNNNFLGLCAGYCNTSGKYNNFFGPSAGRCNNTGCYNNFLGSSAGRFNTSGAFNNFFGSDAGYLNNTGCYNNFLGSRAGFYNSSGKCNNFLGNDAGQYNTTGSCNNFFGVGSGRGSFGNFNTGCHNNFFGSYAGRCNISGNNNNFLGNSAGYCNTTGESNNFFGAYAGCTQTDGSRNVAIGYSVQLPNITGSDQLVIGSGSNSWISGNSSYNVGLGSTNPTQKLWVEGNGYFTGVVTATNFYVGTQLVGGSISGTDLVGTALSVSGISTLGTVQISSGIITATTTTGVVTYYGDGSKLTGTVSISTNTADQAQYLTYVTGTGSTNGFGVTTAGLLFNPSTTRLGIGTNTLTTTLNIGGALGFTNNNIRIGDTNTGCSITSGTHNFFAGSQAGCCNDTGSNNNFLGQYAGRCNTTGSCNNFFGPSAGGNNTTASNNNFLGFYAGYYNTTGCSNNFFGYLAGRNNNEGSFNNFLGRDAGCANTTGRYNNFFGCGAGQNSISGNNNNLLGKGSGGGLFGGNCNTGSNNNFLGQYTGRCNTTGSYNNFFGSNVGRCNTTGSYNNFFGSCAGYCNITGGNNNFLGRNAGYYNASGGNNNFFGCCAGYSNTSGADNIFFGRQAGCLNVTGSQNVVVGYNQQTPISSGNNQLVIGSGSNFWISGNSSYNVGLGTTNPTEKLDVNGRVRFRSSITDNNNVTGTSNQVLTATSAGAGVSWASLTAASVGAISGVTVTNDTATTTPLYPTFTSSTSGSITAVNVDTSGLTFIPGGVGSLGIGTTSPTRNLDVNGEIRLRAGLYDSANQLGTPNQVLSVGAGGSVTWQSIVAGGGAAISGINVTQDDTGVRYPLLADGINPATTAQYIDNNGLVYNTNTNCLGIGSTTPTSRLDIIGDVKVVGIVTASDFNSSSDIKLKTNIKTITNPIEKVLQISGVNFNWKETGKASMGVIAQEVEKVLPELVSDADPKSVNYNGLIGLLIECIKDQQRQIDELKTK